MGTTTDYINAEEEATVDRFIEKLQAAGIDVRNEDTDVDSPDPAEWAAAAVIAWWERQKSPANAPSVPQDSVRQARSTQPSPDPVAEAWDGVVRDGELYDAGREAGKRWVRENELPAALAAARSAAFAEAAAEVREYARDIGTEAEGADEPPFSTLVMIESRLLHIAVELDRIGAAPAAPAVPVSRLAMFTAEVRRAVADTRRSRESGMIVGMGKITLPLDKAELYLRVLEAALGADTTEERGA